MLHTENADVAHVCSWREEYCQVGRPPKMIKHECLKWSSLWKSQQAHRTIVYLFFFNTNCYVSKDFTKSLLCGCGVNWFIPGATDSNNGSDTSTHLDLPGRHLRWPDIHPPSWQHQPPALPLPPWSFQLLPVKAKRTAIKSDN